MEDVGRKSPPKNSKRSRNKTDSDHEQDRDENHIESDQDFFTNFDK